MDKVEQLHIRKVTYQKHVKNAI